MRKITKVEYPNDRTYDTILEARGNGEVPLARLSPLTIETIQASLKNDIVVVFAQDSLNVTPLLCSLLEAENERHILIGLPRRGFAAASRNHMDRFFSLVRDGRFSYEGILWCTGGVQEGKIILSVEDLQKRPVLGLRSFKQKHERRFEEIIASGACKSWPIIASVPIDANFIDDFVGTTPLCSSEKVDILPAFNPEYIILESVNERTYGPEPILGLIKSLAKNQKKGLVHFSWPYFRGIRELVNGIHNIESEFKTKISILHFGKRYCIEMRERFEEFIHEFADDDQSAREFIKSHAGFRDLSIEDSRWEMYYPGSEVTILNDTINLIVVPENIAADERIAELINRNSFRDELLQEIRNDVIEYRRNGKDIHHENLFFFPPFMDSFLQPDEMKVLSRNDSGDLRFVQIEQALRNSNPDLEPLNSLFSSLCRVMSEACDFNNLLRGLSTHRSINKTSSLLAFLLAELCIPRSHERSIVICDYGSTSFKNIQISRIEKLIESVQDTSILRLPSRNFFSRYQCGEPFGFMGVIDLKDINLEFEPHNNAASELIVTARNQKGSWNTHIHICDFYYLESLIPNLESPIQPFCYRVRYLSFHSEI